MDPIKSKLCEIIPAGLVSGLGRPKPGKLCVEAAICLALGEPHSDRPSCVADPDRRYAIAINDASWSTPAVRAEALLPLALAQMDTAGRDRQAWVESLAIGTVSRVLPLALAGIASESVIDQCRRARALQKARAAAVAVAAAAADAAAAAAATDAARWGHYGDRGDDPRVGCEVKLSPAQQEALGALAAHGKLVRLGGGFWTWEGAQLNDHGAAGRVPEWSTSIHTLRALEARGLVQRDPRSNAPEWARPFVRVEDQ